MPFGIGYHPGYTVPFDDKHVATDYELRFSEMESPICVNCLPTGLVQKDHYFLPANINALPIDEELFANDSHCMVNLKSATLGIYEKGTGRAVVCNIAEFPYVLIWSKPGMPKFVCIEPWHSLPSAEGGSIKWEEKPAAAILNPGEAWSCTLSTSFVR
jgi:aldose 1-epimerase